MKTNYNLMKYTRLFSFLFFFTFLSLSSFGQSGCTDGNYENYDPIAVIDDGSCEGLIYQCPGDFDNNGYISSIDLAEFLSVFGTGCIEGEECPGDIHVTGNVNVFDLSEFLSIYGSVCGE